jgi:hypothetical protein
MGTQGDNWGGRKIRKLWRRDDQTVKQCTVTCVIVWEFGVHFSNGGKDYDRRERPAIEIIFGNVLSITTNKKVKEEPISKTSSAVVRVSNQKLRLQF